MGLKRASVTNLIRLNELDDFVKDSVRRGRLRLGHARALLAITNLEQRRQLAELAIRGGWSVRVLERRAATTNGAKTAHGSGGAARTTPSSNRSLEREIGEQLGTKVTVQSGRTKGSGRLIIEFYSLDQFDGLMERLGVTVG